jgi:hypothetical protein
MKNRLSHRNVLLTAALLCTVGCSSKEEDKSNPWVGHTYALTIPEASWTDPPGVAGEIGSFVPRFAIQVEGASGDQLDVLLGVVDEQGQQVTCNPTTATKAVSTGSSGFELGPVSVPIYVENLDDQGMGPKVIGTVYGLKMSNVLPDGATPAEAGTFEGILDAREFYRLFTVLMAQSGQDVCDGVKNMTEQAGLVVTCGACPNDSEPLCLTLKAANLGATEIDTTLQPIDKSSAQTCIPAE